MHTTLLALFFVTCLTLIQAQNCPPTTYYDFGVRSFTTLLNSPASAQPSILFTKIDDANNYYVAGTFVQTVDFSKYAFTAANLDTDAFVAKRHANNSLVWAVHITSPKEDTIHAIHLFEDKVYVLCAVPALNANLTINNVSTAASTEYVTILAVLSAETGAVIRTSRYEGLRLEKIDTDTQGNMYILAATMGPGPYSANVLTAGLHLIATRSDDSVLYSTAFSTGGAAITLKYSNVTNSLFASIGGQETTVTYRTCSITYPGGAKFSNPGVFHIQATTGNCISSFNLNTTVLDSIFVSSSAVAIDSLGYYYMGCFLRTTQLSFVAKYNTNGGLIWFKKVFNF